MRETVAASPYLTLPAMTALSLSPFLVSSLRDETAASSAWTMTLPIPARQQQGHGTQQDPCFPKGTSQ